MTSASVQASYKCSACTIYAPQLPTWPRNKRAQAAATLAPERNSLHRAICADLPASGITFRVAYCMEKNHGKGWGHMGSVGHAAAPPPPLPPPLAASAAGEGHKLGDGHSKVQGTCKREINGGSWGVERENALDNPR